MAESSTTQTTTPKSKPKPVSSNPSVPSPSFAMPKFEMPSFEMPKMEIPAAFRELAEKGLAQAKENYEKMKTTAEETTDLLEDTYANAARGCSGYGLKLIETARTNSNAAFDLFGELFGARSHAEVVELYTAYLRSQFDTAIAQAKDLAEHAQKVASETVEPMKESFSNAFGKAA